MPDTALLDRLEAVRAKRNQPSRIVRLYPSEPTRLSPFVRAAREKRLTPTLINGSWTPNDDRGAA